MAGATGCALDASLTRRGVKVVDVSREISSSWSADVERMTMEGSPLLSLLVVWLLLLLSDNAESLEIVESGADDAILTVGGSDE